MLNPNTRLHKYEIVRLIDQDAQSATYEAIDTVEGTVVTIREWPSGNQVLGEAFESDLRRRAESEPWQPRVTESFVDSENYYVVSQSGPAVSTPIDSGVSSSPSIVETVISPRPTSFASETSSVASAQPPSNEPRPSTYETPISERPNPSSTLPPGTPAPAGGDNRRNCLFLGIGGGVLGLCLVCLVLAFVAQTIGEEASTQLGDLATQVALTPGADFDPDTDTDSDPVVEGEMVSVYDLELGDCINDTASSETLINELERVDCDDPHDNEIYAILEYPADSDAEFPGEDELDAFSEEECVAAFEEFVGISFNDSVFSSAPIQPSEESWAEGDREVICILYDGNGDKLEGSKEGSNE